MGHCTLHPDAHASFFQHVMEEEPDIVAAIMTQLSLKAGLKEWGTEARDAVKSEMKQLHMRNTFKPKHWKELSETQRQCILESHLFLKQNQY